MPQLHSTNSFKMMRHDRVNFSILQIPNILFRSYSVILIIIKELYKK